MKYEVIFARSLSLNKGIRGLHILLPIVKQISNLLWIDYVVDETATISVKNYQIHLI